MELILDNTNNTNNINNGNVGTKPPPDCILEGSREHLPGLPFTSSPHIASPFLYCIGSFAFISFQLVGFYCIFAPFYHHYNPIVFLSFQQKSTCSIGNQTTALSLMKAPVSFINGLEKTNILCPHTAHAGGGGGEYSPSGPPGSRNN